MNCTFGDTAGPVAQCLRLSVQSGLSIVGEAGAELLNVQTRLDVRVWRTK